MIVEFSVKNFRSIKELQTISFVTTGLKSAEKYEVVDKNNIVEEGGMQLFKTLGIYGANASGKSNVVKALSCFIKAVTNPPSDRSNLNELCQPFFFQEDATQTESFFQIVFTFNGVKYRYGLTVKRNNEPSKNDILENSQEIVTNEWLYGKKRKNMSVLFQREGIEKVVNKLSNADKIPSSLPYEHSLFLKHAAAFDKDGICQSIQLYLSLCIGGLNLNENHLFRRYLSVGSLDSLIQKEFILKLFSLFDLRYKNISLEKGYDASKKNITPLNKIILTKKYQNKGEIKLNLEYTESKGTQKIFDLVGSLFICFNQLHCCLIIDEIDSNFHPALLIKLISLFNEPEINKMNSQLLFTSHDTNLMSPEIMRRDQFYFTEKKEDESTRLYSLADLRGIRNDADFARQYLAGYYGALPTLGDYETINTSNERTVELETR